MIKAKYLAKIWSSIRTDLVSLCDEIWAKIGKKFCPLRYLKLSNANVEILCKLPLAELLKEEIRNALFVFNFPVSYFVSVLMENKFTFGRVSQMVLIFLEVNFLQNFRLQIFHIRTSIKFSQI